MITATNHYRWSCDDGNDDNDNGDDDEDDDSFENYEGEGNGDNKGVNNDDDDGDDNERGHDDPFFAMAILFPWSDDNGRGLPEENYKAKGQKSFEGTRPEAI